MLLRLVLGLSLVTRRQFDSYRSCFWDLLDWTRAVFSLKLIISHHCGEPSCELNSMPMSSVCLMGIVTILSPVVSTKHYFLCFWVVISVVLSRYFIDMVYWRSERETPQISRVLLCAVFCLIPYSVRSHCLGLPQTLSSNSQALSLPGFPLPVPTAQKFSPRQ